MWLFLAQTNADFKQLLLSDKLTTIKEQQLADYKHKIASGMWLQNIGYQILIIKYGT